MHIPNDDAQFDASHCDSDKGGRCFIYSNIDVSGSLSLSKFVIKYVYNVKFLVQQFTFLDCILQNPHLHVCKDFTILLLWV